AKYANYWMHNGMIKIENQKMSKSLGNFATIADLVKTYHPELIRFFVLSAQYRQPLDFSKAALIKSAEGLDRIYGALEKYESAKGRPGIAGVNPESERTEMYRQQFMVAMCDDLNTPQAIAVMFELTKMMNLSGMDDPAAYFMLRTLGGILGILQVPAEQWFKVLRIAKDEEELSDEKIEQLLEKRIQARVEKDWALADKIRDQLVEASIQLEDRDGKTFWRRK
ncbi:MAG: class I tRNA ligase family protein, partial [SAR324 cluster bacterium]|nr:class I tRNA ligase family protein [SAR324 cluster bacterium]